MGARADGSVEPLIYVNMSATVSKTIEVGATITLRDLPAVFRIAAAKRRSVFLLSTPGVGKTEVITGLARGEPARPAGFGGPSVHLPESGR
jgi:midasin (ATPase involved in ribosome maturation)